MEDENIAAINEAYDGSMFLAHTSSIVNLAGRYQNVIGFQNNGYWRGGEETLAHAQVNLIETLLDFFVDKRGNVLDVACGIGASTKYLMQYFDPKKITAINISEKQLAAGRLVAPACDFRLMSATSLDFADESIDNVLCIEAAFHFQTRERFLREACRVLRPGGRLAMSDVLLRSSSKENYLNNIDDLRDMLLGAGYSYVRVEDSSEQGHKPYLSYIYRRLERDVGLEPELMAKAVQWFKQGFIDDHMASCMIYAIR